MSSKTSTVRSFLRTSSLQVDRLPPGRRGDSVSQVLWKLLGDLIERGRTPLESDWLAGCHEHSKTAVEAFQPDSGK